ncbi:energy transducer TonB [Verticiella sediminum]|uniref:Energy transducer TonB n=1 Tax=Verticiella sediminum TaxID=1247510 RepID=A0A556A919_9BURK|nr:energy transducer TonB [Verticiella sediminum]TSH89387.1 energy transducer TonB [Verticiella sediminum]
MTVSKTWGSHTSAGTRAAAAAAVLAVHGGVIAALMMARPEPMLIDEPQVVQIRFVEIAPEIQQVQAPPAPEPAPPAPEPVVEPPPPETPPEPPPPEPPPEPEPPPPEPIPEPPPPPPPEPPPKPKPKPPEPKPQPKPQPPRPQPPRPQPPAPQPAPPSPMPPAGTPDAAQQRSAAPDLPQAPRADTPRLVGTVDYLGERPTPDYPRAARRMREEGRVVVRVTINVRGTVDRAVVQRSSGFDRLDQAALAAAQQTRFRPYTENGVAYAAMADIPYDFKLR